MNVNGREGGGENGKETEKDRYTSWLPGEVSQDGPVAMSQDTADHSTTPLDRGIPLRA